MRKKSKLYEKHGISNTPIYSTWVNMLRRCEIPKHPSYKDYGGRSIKVCERWHSFENFYADMDDKPKGLTLERTNNDGNYEPENCEWATWEKNRNNTRPKSSGHCKQYWFRAWHKNMMCQFMSNNQSKFAKQWGLKQATISKCLRGIRNHHYGWKFEKV